MPVSVAEGERSFSKLAIVKNHLRSTMGQGRLSSLVLLSCEHDLAKKLNLHQQELEESTFSVSLPQI